jgi:hypothetical protein
MRARVPCIVELSSDEEMRRDSDGRTPHRLPRLAWDGLEGCRNRGPAEELESVDHCPPGGRTDRVELYRDLTNRVLFMRQADGRIICVAGCEGAYLDSRPTLESIAGAYSRYYTKPHSRAEVMSRRTPSRA